MASYSGETFHSTCVTQEQIKHLISLITEIHHKKLNEPDLPTRKQMTYIVGMIKNLHDDHFKNKIQRSPSIVRGSIVNENDEKQELETRMNIKSQYRIIKHLDFQNLWKAGLLTDDKEKHTMIRFNFESIQTSWIPCYQVTRGQMLQEQKQQKQKQSNHPNLKDYKNANEKYFQDVHKYYWTSQYSKVKLDTTFPVWGTSSAIKLINQQVEHELPEYFYYHIVMFYTPLKFKSSNIGGLMGHCSTDIRCKDYTLHAPIEQNLTSDIPAVDISGKQFDWQDANVYRQFSKHYHDMKVKLQFRQNHEGWFLAGLKFNQVFWSNHGNKPVWVDFE